MKKITNFHILRITMRGFKRFCDEYSLDLDRITYIHGANGEGKSTIADAIAYAFCGTPFWGEKSCERLQNNECGEMSVEVQFVDECGEVHTLTRRRVGSSTTIVFDTMTVRQSDVVNLFAEKDVFLSLLNPLYFIEKIAEDGREFLQKLVPVVKQEEILAQMSDSERTLLEHENLLDPEYFIKQRREELKEYEESTVYLEGQRDLLNQQYDDAVAKLDAALKRGNEIVARKTELEKRQFEGVDIDGLKVRKEEITALSAEISALSTACAKLAAKIKSIRPGDICPTCRTAVTAENYRSIIAGLRTEYDEMRTRGMEMVAKRDALGSPDEIGARILRGNLTAEEFAELQTLTAQAEDYRKEVELLYQANDIPKRVAEIEHQLSECATEKAEKQTLIQAANAYAAKKAELTLQSLQMNHAAIRLYDVVKSTGELKSVFRFTYDGKDYRWLSTSEKIRAGLEVSALCPFCGDTKYHLGLNRAKERFFCFRCKASGNSVTLYARLHGIGNREAHRILKGELDTRAETMEYHKSTEIPVKSIEYRHDVYYDFLNLLRLSTLHRQNLELRGLTFAHIHQFMYRSIPTDEVFRREVLENLAARHDLRGIPGFWYDERGDAQMYCKSIGGMFIPVCDKDGYIQGLQMRLDVSPESGEKKFRWFSSRNFPNGTGAKSWIHVVGGTSSREACVTEGAMKADIASVLTGGRLFIAVPGVNALANLPEVLRELRITKVYEAFDMDKRAKPEIKQALLSLRRMLADMGIVCEGCAWDSRYKGIDDYVYARSMNFNRTQIAA